MVYALWTAVQREGAVVFYMSITGGHARKIFLRPLLAHLDVSASQRR